MRYTTALEHLESLINHEARPRAGRIAGLSLDTMTMLTSAMGDPHRCYPVVHITGTNGKGSTVRITASLLEAMGLKVGAYTSPHLMEPNERIEVNSVPIDQRDFGAAIGRVAALVEFLDIRATWFETVTAAALDHFADAGVDVAVVEVGMLGRYDATNVVEASVAAVTNVGFDHTDGRGDWRHAVAHEKAGIIKPSSVVVCGEPDASVRQVFRAEPSRQMIERGPDFGVYSDQLAVGGRLVGVYTPHDRYDSVLLGLHGRHQADNASLAVATAEAFFDSSLKGDAVSQALGTTRVPGRFEIAGRRPLVVLDGAHNPDGARAAAQTLREGFAPAGRRILVVGMQTGRDLVDVLSALEAGTAALVVTCTAPTVRGVPAIEVARAAALLGATTRVCDDPADALAAARDWAHPDDVIVVTGSFTVVGAARRAMRRRHRSAVP